MHCFSLLVSFYIRLFYVTITFKLFYSIGSGIHNQFLIGMFVQIPTLFRGNAFVDSTLSNIVIQSQMKVRTLFPSALNNCTIPIREFCHALLCRLDLYLQLVYFLLNVLKRTIKGGFIQTYLASESCDNVGKSKPFLACSPRSCSTFTHLDLDLSSDIPTLFAAGEEPSVSLR